MGLIARLFGGPSGAATLATAAAGVAEVFVPNATRRAEMSHEAFTAVVAAQAEEFRAIREGWFDRLVNGLNRLPRPFLALGTLGLFVYAMADPEGFAERMIGLGHVPEPLWWLLGAVVSFYFGAREMHYFRGAGGRRPTLPQAPMAEPVAPEEEDERPAPDAAPVAGNAALAEWRRGR